MWRACARPRLLLLLLSCVAHAHVGAQLPSAAQVQALVQQRGAGDMVRARIQQSGLTAEQIRARLRASGYDADLLDAFLTEEPPSTSPSLNTDQTAALRALGLSPADTTSVDSVRSVPTAVRRPTEDPPSGVFGVDVFRRTTTQFLPLLSGPVPPDYRLGPGDVVVLILTGDVELTHQLSITREGFVLIPQVGQVFLANLTLAQARNVLYDRLRRAYSGISRGADATTQFDLSVANVRAIQVYVVGEVSQPGAYQLSALGTVLTAIYTAGGVTDLANLRAVNVRRGGSTVATFDLYEYLLQGNTQNDVRLENGDVVYVGVQQRRATVRGSVLRPATYDLAETESLSDLVAAAGGVAADASLTRISIERIVPPEQRTANGPQRVALDVTLEPGKGTIPPVAIEAGDIVSIFALPNVARNSVELRGNVYLPGKFALEPRLTLSQLVARGGGLQPGTYRGRAHISRLNRADQTRRTIPVTLPADSAAPWREDPVLEDGDEVTIYSRLEMRPERTITVVGAVTTPGTVAWREGMTLRDAILEARGLAPGASLDSVEIARLPTNRRNGQLAETFRVALDSTYLFDRDSLGRYIGPPGTAFRPSGAPEVQLRPWDNVLILRQPEFEFQRPVTIRGEVRFPGTYALRNKNERLTSIIARAGGLTDRAYPDGVRFLRLADAVGRLGVDLPRALRQPGSNNDVILRPGDDITIPEFLPSVRVTGAVNSPGSVLWERGKSIAYYLNAAGGLAANADGGQASVRQANGQVVTRRRGFLFFGRSDPHPSPGSTVTVPEKPDRPARDNITLLTALASVIASSATIVIALVR
jgi:protein involved in polysaccharide export with SLBB domain